MVRVNFYAYMQSWSSMSTNYCAVPPDPVTKLMVTNVDETKITIAWSNSNGFEGNTPITRARVEYYAPADPNNIQSDSVPGDNPTSHTLTGLTPFALYNISVLLFNNAGHGEPVFTKVTTLSLSK